MRRGYLHGFASGPLAFKGRRLKREFEARGMPFALPDLNVPSFAKLSARAMLETLDALDAREGDDEGWAFVASSLGGWVAARWAELHPDRVARLILLCPAFDLCARWTALASPGEMERWRSEGSLVTADGAGTKTPLHYRFYEELCEEPAYPSVSCETQIIHGTRDERVPIEGSREYARSHPNVELIEVDDAHDLHASIDLIVEHALTRLS